MEYRRLGRTDLNVSLICLGTMTWGQQNTEAEGHEQMDYALDQGVNFFDTAELYSIPPKAETQGSTERIIGSWFKARGTRDRVILASKIVGRTDMSWFRGGKPAEVTRDQIVAAVEVSVIPQPSSTSTPAASKKRRISGLIGAAPETARRILPPKRLRIFDSTCLSAKA